MTADQEGSADSEEFANHTQEEIELKFAYEGDGDAIRNWLDKQYPARSGQGWQTHEISDRYLDTADEALKQAGYGARLRTVGSDTTLTVKATIDVGEGLHRRLELEARATRDLDIDQWPDSEARARLLDVVGERRLIETFVLGQQRRERAVNLAGATAMASIDAGEVEYLGLLAGEIRHFEVELSDGGASALKAIASQVAASGLATPVDESKLQLAAKMAERAGRVAPDDAWSDAARKLLRRHLLRMVERESATRAGDVLALKQMRVATRRMRATWRVFGTAFAGGHARHFGDDLRHVAGLLGAVRDLDVLLETVEKRDDVAQMAAIWRARRDAAFDELMRHLDSRQYQRFVDDFLEGTRASAFWAAGKHARDRVAEGAPGRLDEARARMLDAAEIAGASNEAAAWHALRITAKRMRYSLEAFREVLDERAATDFIERLRKLQDNLGEMNDASVAAREAASWLTSVAGADAPPAQRVAVARYIGQAEASVARARLRFVELWPPLAESPVPPIGS